MPVCNCAKRHRTSLLELSQRPARRSVKLLVLLALVIIVVLFFGQESLLETGDHSVVQKAVDVILKSKPVEVGSSSSDCARMSAKSPIKTHRGGLTEEALEILNSSDYKKFAGLMLSDSCNRTLTIDMARPGGQFGSHFNMEVISFSLLGFMTRRTVIFEMDKSPIGRWCRFFVSPGRCTAHDKSNAYAVERVKGRVNVHWMVDETLHDHVYFSYSDPELLIPIHNILTHHLRVTQTPKGVLLLFRKFVYYLWQLPDDMIGHLAMLKEALGLKEPFVGAHIRWGDKKTEATPVSSRVYAKMLRDMADNSETRTIFIMSDSGDAVREISNLLPEYHIKTTTPPTWRGNEMKSFYEMPLEEREGQIRLLILELSIMSQADSVVCTMSSNICRLLQILRIQPPETIIGIDVRDFPSVTEYLMCLLAHSLPFTSFEVWSCMDLNRQWYPF